MSPLILSEVSIYLIKNLKYDYGTNVIDVALMPFHPRNKYNCFVFTTCETFFYLSFHFSYSLLGFVLKDFLGYKRLIFKATRI